MNRNTLTLVAVWIVILLFGGYMLYGFVLGALQGNYIGLFAIVFAVIMAVGIRWYVHSRIARLLKQSETAGPLLAYYQRALGRNVTIPNRDALYAHAAALIQIFYGDYPGARASLDSIDWAGRMPLIQGSGQSVEALLCYFETHEYEKGLELARAAQEQAQIASAVPGAKTSAAAFGSYVEIGEILCDRGTPEILESLRNKAKKLPTMGKLIIAWGLAVGYKKAGDAAKVESMQAYIRKTAPYCRALATDI